MILSVPFIGPIAATCWLLFNIWISRYLPGMDHINKQDTVSIDQEFLRIGSTCRLLGHSDATDGRTSS